MDVVSIQHFAEFGVGMMLFLVGLELEPKMLWSMRARLLGLGGGQVALTAGLVMAAAIALGQVWTVALAIGLIPALSLAAIVLQTLGERGLMKRDGEGSSFAVLLTPALFILYDRVIAPRFSGTDARETDTIDVHGDMISGSVDRPILEGPSDLRSVCCWSRGPILARE